jgi:GrpB-like predicted nucleotidyltransferase (UPF0157 family)
VDKLAFRDYLRAHPLRAAAYGELKHRLALDHPHDIVSYIRGKEWFIKSLLEDARRWYHWRDDGARSAMP